MVSETGIVLAVGAAFLLLGIAISPLAWVAIWNHRSRSERLIERRFVELQGRLGNLDERMAGCESSLLTLQSRGESSRGNATRPRPIPAAATMGWLRSDGAEAAPGGSPGEVRLISVPNLAAATGDREAMLSGLTQRYAAIWALADKGATADVIARATGQPIGQIELILGLRRQIDGTRTTIPHASHE
jgi:hypothetical protein